MIRILLLFLLCCGTVGAGPLAAAETDTSSPIWPRPVGRNSGDRDADLIDALIERGRFDEAIEICRSASQSLDPTSDAAAKWSVRRSQIRAARQLTQADFDADAIASAEQPVSDLLESYPEHDRRLFLRAQQLRVLGQAARHDVTAAAVSAGTNDLSDRALVRLTRLLRQTEELVEEIDAKTFSLGRVSEENALSDSIPPTDWAAELTRLKQRLRVDRVGWALIRTELFPPASRDQIAAATRAEQLATEAIEGLPRGSAARREMRRLRIDALLRSGQPQQADQAMKQLGEKPLDSSDPRLTALRVQIDRAIGRSDAAARRLEAYYGDQPAQAPRSAAMDLARLEYLLDRAEDGDPQVGAWIDAIEQRSGAYVRRRAEAMALDRLHRDGGAGRNNPALVAAQGHDWLRRGEPMRAGELLSAAARAETDSDQAIRRATEAAAAWVSAGRPRQAAEILAEVSIAHPDAENAAAAHLQAAVTTAEAASAVSEGSREAGSAVNSSAAKGLAGPAGQTDANTKSSETNDSNARDSGQPDSEVGTELLESRLRQTIQTWPASDQAASARRWLVKLLTAQSRWTDAAEIATPETAERATDPRLSQTINRWQQAIRRSDPDRVAEVGERFQAALEPLLGDRNVAAQFRRSAILLLERSQLKDLPSRPDDSNSAAVAFVEALLRFRRGGPVESPLKSPPERLRDLAEWRLMRDGRQQSSRRRQIANLISQWPDPAESSTGEVATPSTWMAERLLWQGKTSEAVAKWRTLAAQSDSPASVLRRAASTLGAADDAQAAGAAVEIWDQLAAGVPKGSPQWHEAKLASIRVLTEAGRRSEATRRARYILLTTPPEDAPLKRRYQSLTEP